MNFSRFAPVNPPCWLWADVIPNTAGAEIKAVTNAMFHNRQTIFLFIMTLVLKSQDKSISNEMAAGLVSRWSLGGFLDTVGSANVSTNSA